MHDAFRVIGERIQSDVTAAMSDVGNELVEAMRDKLVRDGHTGTGELIASIQSSVAQTETGVDLTVDAGSVAAFIEHGTGAAHGVPGGRQGYWRYRDKQGNWHTTDGMDADPFIEPSIEDVMSNLGDVIKGRIREEW